MHASHHIQSTWPSHSPSFLSSLILIISGGRCNLWSYSLCSFLQFPITHKHKSLRTDQHCSQTQSMAFPLCHRPNVTPTIIQILNKHTCVYTWIASFQEAERKAKHYEAAVCIAPTSFPLNFFTLQSLLLNATPKHFKFPSLPKFQTIYLLGQVFTVWKPHCTSRIYNKRRNVAYQCTSSL